MTVNHALDRVRHAGSGRRPSRELRRAVEESQTEVSAGRITYPEAERELWAAAADRNIPPKVAGPEIARLMAPTPAAMRDTVNVRHWPGKDTWEERTPCPTARSIEAGLTIYAAAFAERGVTPERLGIGFALIVNGWLPTRAVMVYDDNLDRPARRRLQRWARKHPCETSSFGPIPIEVMGRREFGKEVLWRIWYNRRATLSTADPGRFFGLMAEDWWKSSKSR